MKTGICLLSCVPMRAEPSDKSEMVSQLLFGETFVIIDQKDGWLYICSDIDAYCGWVTEKMVPTSNFNHITAPMQVVSLPYVTCILPDNQTNLHLPGGSILPAPENRAFNIAGEAYVLNGDIAVKPDMKHMALLARQYLGAPYLWGGKTCFGIDCSGLVQVIFRMMGRWIPRDAWQQEQLGDKIDANEAREGDLAFFSNHNAEVVHVGILSGNNQIIHASGKVRIDQIDSQGIFNTEEQQYTHQLYSIRRIFKNIPPVGFIMSGST